MRQPPEPPPKRRWTAPGYGPLPEPPPTRGRSRRETLIAVTICFVLACTVWVGIAVVVSIAAEKEEDTAVAPKRSEKPTTTVKPTPKPYKSQPLRDTPFKKEKNLICKEYENAIPLAQTAGGKEILRYEAHQLGCD